MDNPFRQLAPRVEHGLEQLRQPFREFISAQATSSSVLLLAVVAALAVANSPFRAAYESLQGYPLGLVAGDVVLSWPLQHFVNDGLMAVFFFLIGLEIKRELLAGHLREPGHVGLLGAAAAGGMVIPAAIYLIINAASADGQPAGWGMPIATDTAMALGVLMLVGRRIPSSMVVFLTGLAILDDIGAILVIAMFYTEGINVVALALAAALVLSLFLANLGRLRHPAIYVTGGIALWVATVQSGLHASIAGVIVAATVPARPDLPPAELRRNVRRAVEEVPAEGDEQAALAEEQTHHRIARIEQLAQAGTAPLRRWEAALETPVALLVLPLFAFLNAGVPVDYSALARVATDPVALGVAAGLVLGKPVGIVLGVRLGQRLGGITSPAELAGSRLLGIGLIAGVGFTMSTFIANLALGPGASGIDAAKLAIVIASAVAATAGFWVLRRTVAAGGEPRRRDEPG